MGKRFECREYNAARIGRNIKAARMAAGWSQTDLSRQLGCSQPYIALLEGGHKNITVQGLMEIKFLLGVATIDWFIYGEHKLTKKGALSNA